MHTKIKKKIRRIHFDWRKQSLLGGGILLLIFLSFQWQGFFQSYSKEVPTEGGIFTESTIGTTVNINPLSSEATIFDKDLQSLLFSGLLEYNPISGQIGEGLATFRVSEDGLEYYLTLKDAARFSNGEPVTIEDIIFTYEGVLQNPNFKNDQLSKRFEYAQLQKIDDKNIVFILPEPNSYFPAVLTTPILYAKAFEGALIEEILDPLFLPNKTPIGTGPYVLQNIVPESDGSFRVFLERNRFYFKKVPFIKQVVFYVYPSFDYLRFDHTWTTLFSHIPFLKLVEFQDSLFGEYDAREYLLPRFLGVFFNLDNPTLAHISARNALMFGVKKDELLEKNKGWKRIDSLFFFEGVDAWHETDFAAGRRLLREARFVYDANKDTQNFKGEPAVVKLITSTSPPVYSRFAQLLVQEWKQEYSLDVDLQVLTPTEFQKALEERDYDAVLFGQDYSENMHSLSTWHSSQSGKINLSNLTNRDIDFLINEIYLTGAKSELFELSQKLNNLVPAIPLATPQYNLLVSPELKGFSDNFGKLRRHGDRFYGIEDWYFQEKRVWDLSAGSYKIWEFIKYLFS